MFLKRLKVIYTYSDERAYCRKLKSITNVCLFLPSFLCWCVELGEWVLGHCLFMFFVSLKFCTFGWTTLRKKMNPLFEISQRTSTEMEDLVDLVKNLEFSCDIHGRVSRPNPPRNTS
jgi:dolichol kinase